MGRPRKYKDLYGAQTVYLQTPKGKAARSRYENSQKRLAQQREWARNKRGTIVDKRQWFINNYGDPDLVLTNLKDEEQKRVIELYYGLTGAKPINQTEIGEILNKPQPSISRILRNARKQLTPLKQSASEPSQELEAAKSQS